MNVMTPAHPSPIRRERLGAGYWKLYQGAGFPYANLTRGPSGWRCEVRAPGGEIVYPSGDTFPTLTEAEVVAREAMERVTRYWRRGA